MGDWRICHLIVKHSNGFCSRKGGFNGKPNYLRVLLGMFDCHRVEEKEKHVNFNKPV